MAKVHHLKGLTSLYIISYIHFLNLNNILTVPKSLVVAEAGFGLTRIMLLWDKYAGDLIMYVDLVNSELNGDCSIVGKPSYYHASDPGSIPRGGHTHRSPYPIALLGQPSPPSFRGW